jgi:hypothetical protein
MYVFICFYEFLKFSLPVVQYFANKSTEYNRREGKYLPDVLAKYCNVLGVLSSRWNFIVLQKSKHYS